MAQAQAEWDRDNIVALENGTESGAKEVGGQEKGDVENVLAL